MILRNYTTADLPNLKAWLSQAVEARRVVATGGRVQSASYGGKSVTYSSANTDQLASWIRDLSDTIAWLEGGTLVGSRPRPIYLGF